MLSSTDCDVNAVGREGWSALAVAVFIGRLEVARLLIDSGADVTAVFGEEQHTLLHAAVYKDFPDMLSLLLTNESIEVNAVDVNGRTAVDYSAYYGRTSCLEALLLDPRTDMSVGGGNNSLTVAACRGHSSTARLLLDLGGGIPATTFYDQLLVSTGAAVVEMNRRAILIAAQSAYCPECFFALLSSVGKAAVDAERSSWRGIQRTRPNTTQEE